MAAIRLQYFDQMKGIAIILVVIGHVMQFSFGYNPSDVVNMLGVFHMPIFFYISGYFMYNEFANAGDMMHKLFKRSINLLVPFLVFGSLWCAFSGTNVTDLILGGGGRYWFLWVLSLLSVFFMVYGYALQKIKKEWLYVILWMLPYCAIMAAKILEYRIGGGNLISISHLNTYYRYFLIGYLCRRYVKFNDLLFKNDIIYSMSFVFFFLQWRYCTMHNMALIFLGGMGAIIVLQRYFESKQNSDNNLMNCLTKVGQASLSIYVIHYFFIPDASSIMHTFLDIQNPFIWQLTFSLLLSLPIVSASMFVGKLIETNKYLNVIFFGRLFK